MIYKIVFVLKDRSADMPLSDRYRETTLPGPRADVIKFAKAMTPPNGFEYLGTRDGGTWVD
jgi:hypothetical protein